MKHSPSIQPDFDRSRQLSRLGGAYFVRAASLIPTSINRDLITTVTFLAITRANVRELTTDWEKARPFGAIQAIPPDEIRRPVSVYAVARELRMPYETVRRHSLKLRELDLCEATEAGLIIPNRAFARPQMLQGVQDHWLLVADMVNLAAKSGIVATVRAPAAAADVSRQVMRIGIEYFLDGLAMTADRMELDFLPAVILRAISDFNIRGLVDDPRGRLDYASMENVPADELRKPVSVYAVAKALHLPYETTRRSAQHLIDRGYVEKVDAGLYVPSRVVSSPQVMDGLADFADLSMRFLNQLAAIGVAAGRKSAAA